MGAICGLKFHKNTIFSQLESCYDLPLFFGKQYHSSDESFYVLQATDICLVSADVKYIHLVQGFSAGCPQKMKALTFLYWRSWSLPIKVLN